MMSEKLGFVFSLFIFFILIIPFGLNVWYLNLQSDHFMKITNEVQKIVNQEGGATIKVLSLAHELDKKDIKVFLKDTNNKDILGACNPGETVYLTYSYKFKNVYGKIIEFRTSNSVLILKRRSEQF